MTKKVNKQKALEAVAAEARALLDERTAIERALAEHREAAAEARARADEKAEALARAEAAHALGEAADLGAAEEEQAEAEAVAKRAERAEGALEARLSAYLDTLPERAEDVIHRWHEARERAVEPLLEEFRQTAARLDELRTALFHAMRVSRDRVHWFEQAALPDPRDGKQLLSNVSASKGPQTGEHAELIEQLVEPSTEIWRLNFAAKDAARKTKAA